MALDAVRGFRRNLGTGKSLSFVRHHAMSIHSGQRQVSIRRRILAYCEQHGITVPPAFHELDPVLAIALVRVFTPEKALLVGETFYNGKSALKYLKHQDKHPENYRCLDFKRGLELVLEHELRLTSGPRFDNQEDVDVQR